MAVAAAIVLQLLLPDPSCRSPGSCCRPSSWPCWWPLVAVNPFRIDRPSRVLRMLGLAMLAVVSLSNGWSAVLLVRRILGGKPTSAAVPAGRRGAPSG